MREIVLRQQKARAIAGRQAQRARSTFPTIASLDVALFKSARVGRDSPENGSGAECPDTAIPAGQKRLGLRFDFCRKVSERKKARTSVPTYFALILSLK